VAGSWGPLLAFWSSWHPLKLSILPLTHLPYLVMNPKWDWVIPSAFACEFASSGTWGSFELRDSCYSWWLPPPRWLGSSGGVVARVGDCSWPPLGDLWGVLVPSPAEHQRQLLWIARVIELPHLWVGSYGVHGLDKVCATPLSRWTTKCWSIQRGRSVPASTRTLGEKDLCLLPFGILPVCWLVIILEIGSSPTWRILIG
jgi:hypothetical protein